MCWWGWVRRCCLLVQQLGERCSLERAWCRCRAWCVPRLLGWCVHRSAAGPLRSCQLAVRRLAAGPACSCRLAVSVVAVGSGLAWGSAVAWEFLPAWCRRGWTCGELAVCGGPGERLGCQGRQELGMRRSSWWVGGGWGSSSPLPSSRNCPSTPSRLWEPKYRWAASRSWEPKYRWTPSRPWVVGCLRLWCPRCRCQLVLPEEGCWRGWAGGAGRRGWGGPVAWGWSSGMLLGALGRTRRCWTGLSPRWFHIGTS